MSSIKQEIRPSLRQAGYLPLILTALMVLGCVHTKIPKEGPTMKEIYHAHTQDQYVHHRALRPIGPFNTEPRQYSRDAHNEIEAIFPKLPNPTLIMYVYPHLAGPNQVPVPGYSTQFTLYEKTEYALPGEAEGR